MNPAILLSKYGSCVSLSLDGGNILSWQVYNEKTKNSDDIFYIGSTERRGGMPVLFPFANPLDDGVLKISHKKIGQHGFARDSNWQLVNMSESSAKISLTNLNISPEMQIAYPFEFQISIIVSLKSPNSLEYTIEVKNTDKKDLPIAPGLHPYFALNHLSKPQLKIMNSDASLDLHPIDWENDMDGNFYNWTDKSMVCVFPDKIITIAETDTKHFENIVVWSQTPQKSDTHFVCIEPFTRKTNAINDQPILVKPSSAWSTTLIFSVVN